MKEVLAQPDSNDLGARMLRFLMRQLPASGPPKNEERSKQLDTGIYEFRMTPKRGPALRVLWMYCEGRTIVCIHGYWKTTQRTAPAYITKVFRGTVNLTLETMSRLALAVGASVRLHVAPINQRTSWQDVAITKGRQDGTRLKRASSGHR